MNKLLVANRSEIAVRIFQACREMGIPTVAIYTAEDHEARHVTYADEAVQVKSYLDPAEIVRVAQETKTTLIHPGYGFLSERPVFARAVEQAKIHFVGPRAETMELMGEKIAAKELAEKLGVPTLPWDKIGGGKAAKSADLQKAAERIGFPLLLKAAAGGGGKGMRRVDASKDVQEAAESARAEAEAAFGDGTLFLEKLVVSPRHIEVQVFGDGKGGGVHLYERECSLQRRHQKIWEEAPAPHLKPETRKRLHEAALKIVAGTKYRSAGTLEFLVDAEENFYFLEMNTRLQVEHPVTEAITGVDLVVSQIELALGKTPALLKEPITSRGHSIEVRLYAEDPAQGYMPTPGKVLKLKWPTGPGIRVDSGIEEGQTIGTLFDPMIAKLIVQAESRERALARMKYALEETVILGLGTNQHFLHKLCTHPQVIEGRVTTHFLGDELGDFYPEPAAQEKDVVSAVHHRGIARAGASSHGQSASGARLPTAWEWVKEL